MFLKSLELHGFKTFAQKTRMEFRPGVTAIVGPNGCGKSNLVDAIRWVLGESNARSLRGELMEDVIFSGSEEVKPLGMAEVGITVVNDDNLLPIEFSEVTVKRRLYRSGESEFFINNNSVRLRDIHDLFADTGIGKPSYSIMEQGNIDLILSNKPEERMVVFEEAAGITRYKTRIKESYRKLAATEENLARLGLVIGEVEKEYRHLERQAQKALAYKELKKEEMRWETRYNQLRVAELRRQLEQNNRRLQELLGKRREVEQRQEQLNESMKGRLERMRSIENDNAETKNRIYKIEADLETISSKVSHIQERVAEAEAEVSKRHRRIQESEAKREELRQRVAEVEAEHARLEELLASQEGKLASYEQETAQLQETIRRNAAQVSANRGLIRSNEEKLEELRARLKEIVDRLVHEIDAVREKFSGDELRKNQLMEQVHQSFSRIESTLKHHLNRLQDLAYAVPPAESFTHLVGDLAGEARGLVEKVHALSGDVRTVLAIQEDLSNLLFGEESLHTRKTRVEEEIEGCLETSARINQENMDLEEETGRSRERLQSFEEMANGVRLDMTRNRERQRHIQENLERMQAEMEHREENLQDIEVEIRVLEERRGRFQKEIAGLRSTGEELEREKDTLNSLIEQNNRSVQQLFEQVRAQERELEKTRAGLEELQREVEKLEIRNAETDSRLQTILEAFRERYGRSLETEPEGGELDPQQINRKRGEIRNRISELGQVNLMAIEEFEEVGKRYQYLAEQREDLEKGKADLHGIVEQTLESSRERFMSSFTQVQENFNSIFRRLFNGGRTELFLTNPDNIFETGVELMACPPGKSLKRRTLLSGGEKSLTAVALLFSIFMVKPSPFCLLDEVDHDLDEENVLRFLKLLKEFTDTTQFLIITHNRRTIEFSDVIYGVTSEQAGVSKVVSLEMVQHAIQ
ncbi:MAG: chromosome segregation SMC family protein [Spirochaetota bacterium]